MNITDRFILVDDDPLNNLISKYTILKYNKNADIQLFTDPEIALAKIKEKINSIYEGAKTIILLDINMPIMNGWEFLDEFIEFGASFHKHFSIYMISSSIDQIDMDRADNHSLVSGFFSKPLNSEHLKVASGNGN